MERRETMTIRIEKATRKQKKAKIALIGPSGGGKTYSALRLAKGLAAGGKILLADTERGSASLYSDLTDFDTCQMPNFDVETFIEVIETAHKTGYAVLVVDSISHAWEKLLEEHELEASRQKNSFTAWAKITPRYQL